MKYQILIIGGGPAGYTAAEAAGKAGLSVALFEKQNVGGVCLNEGCIPTKTLLYSAKTYNNFLHASKYGIAATEISFDLPRIIDRKSKIVRKLILGIKAKLANSGVTIVSGEAQITNAYTVRCNDEIYEGDYLLICTGSDIFIPTIKGIGDVNYWTHRDALNNKKLPQSLTIIGGGVIGMEFASFFNSLGTKVTIIEMLDEILGGMDKELSAMLRTEYTKRGIDFLTSTKVTAVNENEDGIHVEWERGNEKNVTTAEKLLMSVGRRPVTEGFGLENIDIQKTERGNIIVNDEMETSTTNVYVCGDLTGFSMLAHTAEREAAVAIHSILYKLGKTTEADKMSYRAVPGVVYTNPEIASIGETEETLKKKNISYRAIKLPMTYSGRFVVENEGINGICKLLIADNNTLLGAHLLGNPASEIITAAGMAIELKLTVEEWKKIIFPHPTVCEIFKEVL